MSSATQERVATPPKAGRFYLPELDFLRFLAFFAIFLFHLPEPFVLKFFDRPGALGDVGRAGAFGVDLFFTLSGYLITRLLMREREESGDINLRAFYARRTLKIWPLYYFSLGLAFLLTQFPARMTTAPQLIGNVFAPMKPSAYVFFAIFLFNFNFYQSLLTYPLPLMGLLWSISVEEQFYLFWPWFVRYLPRGRLFVVPIVMIAVACITRASLTWDLSRLLWNYTFARLDPIAVGILIALMPALKPGRALRLSLVAVGIASWLFASGWCGLPYELGRVDIAIGYPAIALGSGAFVLATLGTKSFNPGSALARRLIYLGKISYGLYVYNSIAYSTAALLVYRALAPESARTWKTLSLYVPLAFALNVAFAAASYRLLEAPFLRLKERFTRVPSRAV
jgi:peptidoglycan/LPS O-acetylase OafA/YrhL